MEKEGQEKEEEYDEVERGNQNVGEKRKEVGKNE